MPSIPEFKCEALRCTAPKVRGSSYCVDHSDRPQLKIERLEANRAYKHRSWESIRASQLSKQPLCQACSLDNRVTIASQVDHVFAWRHIGKHAFTNNLFQSLCSPCHSLKTANERKGEYQHFTSDRLIVYGLSDYAHAIRSA